MKVDIDEVKRNILNLTSDWAVDHDGSIPGSLVKRFKNILILPITFLCSLDFKTSAFPSAFKVAVAYPIDKSGDRNCVSNCRLISLLPTLSKILEKFLYLKLTHFLERRHLLSSSQYGSRSGISTANAVLDLTNYTVKKLDNKQKVKGIFLEIATAFDTTSAPKLIVKMIRLGIRGINSNFLRATL